VSERSPASNVALAWTGASGIQYGIRLLECLLEADCQVSLMVSKPAQVVVALETDLSLPGRPADMQKALQEKFAAGPDQLRVYGRDQWTAPLASGSAVPDAMVICPCTTATVSALATGASRSLIERAGDVVLKEGRELLLVVRETPFSAIHLENMLRLARAGACVMPAAPGFYHRPRQVSDLVDFMVARVMDRLALPQRLIKPWGEEPQGAV